MSRSIAVSDHFLSARSTVDSSTALPSHRATGLQAPLSVEGPQRCIYKDAYVNRCGRRYEPISRESNGMCDGGALPRSSASRSNRARLGRPAGSGRELAHRLRALFTPVSLCGYGMLALRWDDYLAGVLHVRQYVQSLTRLFSSHILISVVLILGFAAGVAPLGGSFWWINSRSFTRAEVLCRSRGDPGQLIAGGCEHLHDRCCDLGVPACMANGRCLTG